SNRRHNWSAGDLRAYEKRRYSQNGEDGILEEIFRRIGVGGRYFVEFGAETGEEGNCARLARELNWSGTYLECDPVKYARLAGHYAQYPGIRTVQEKVTSANVERL